MHDFLLMLHDTNPREISLAWGLLRSTIMSLMQVYLKCLAVIDEDHDRPELQVNTAILLIAAALERALGDVRTLAIGYLWFHHSGMHTDRCS